MSRMKITAFFDTSAEAERTGDDLARQLGLDRGEVQVHCAESRGGDDEGGFLDWLARIWRPEADFLPPEDRDLLGEGLRRGGAVLSAEIQEGDLTRATQTIEAHGAVDLDTRSLQWRDAGWTGAGPRPARPRVWSYPWAGPVVGAPGGLGRPPRV
jgi:hypothetical protein